MFLLLAGTAVVWLSSADARDALPTQVTGAGTARWYKGNLHTHTLSSDGDSTPDEVVRWYREHGYDFVVLTDHNLITEVDTLNAPQGAPGRFLVVRGEEVTSRVGDKPIHVNGFDLRRLVEPPLATTVVTTVQRMVDGIREANGVPSVNHPNFGWAISADELASVQRSRLFELYNGHPLVNNQGGGGVPGLEEVWDRLLSSGKLIYGIAVDDAHHFKRPWEPAASSPGHGWVYVHSALRGRWSRRWNGATSTRRPGPSSMPWKPAPIGCGWWRRRRAPASTECSSLVAAAACCSKWRRRRAPSPGPSP